MSNTISQNPNMITLDRNDPSVWSFPTTAEQNPAAQAREEYEQGLYVEALASDTAEPVNEFETVPTATESQTYVTNAGEAIDPAHAEAVLAHAQAVVEDAFNADPSATVMQQAQEVQRMSREQHDAAVAQADLYAPRLDDIRTATLEAWGANRPE